MNSRTKTLRYLNRFDSGNVSVAMLSGGAKILKLTPKPQNTSQNAMKSIDYDASI